MGFRRLAERNSSSGGVPCRAAAHRVGSAHSGLTPAVAYGRLSLSTLRGLRSALSTQLPSH